MIQCDSFLFIIYKHIYSVDPITPTAVPFSSATASSCRNIALWIDAVDNL